MLDQTSTRIFWKLTNKQKGHYVLPMNNTKNGMDMGKKREVNHQMLLHYSIYCDDP